MFDQKSKQQFTYKKFGPKYYLADYFIKLQATLPL